MIAAEELRQTWRRWTAEVSYSGAWKVVLEALADLYELYYVKGVTAEQVAEGLDNLMRAYDRWLG